MTKLLDLLTLLKETRHETIDVIHRLDLEHIVYVKSGWRVHDVITHLSWSDKQAVQMISHFLEDKLYSPPSHLTINTRSDIHRRNAYIRRQHYHDSPQEVISQFMNAHESLKSLIKQVGNFHLHQEFTAYWGERITTCTLAIWQIQHDQHHQRDLKRIIGCPPMLDKRIYHLVYSDV